MAPYFNNPADTQLRIMSALSYTSMGIIGLLYVLFNGKNNKSQFFQFHFIQALLIGVIMILTGWAGQGLGSFVEGILGLFGNSLMGASQIILLVLALAMKLIGAVLMIANIFGIVQSLRGKYADMPVVSKIVRSNIR